MSWSADKPRYRPKFPAKYRGDAHNIVVRSSWELKVFRRLDENPEVLWWSSEETVIPYTDSTSVNRDGSLKLRRYFPDVLYETKKGGIVLAEIKPRSQSPLHVRTIKTKGRSRRSVIAEAMTLSKNRSKWEAAARWCKLRGWRFQVLTEKELGIF